MGYTFLYTVGKCKYQYGTVSNDITMVTYYSTKYMGGHSDIVAGCISFANEELMKKAHRYSTLLGSSLVSDNNLCNVCLGRCRG